MSHAAIPIPGEEHQRYILDELLLEPLMIPMEEDGAPCGLRKQEETAVPAMDRRLMEVGEQVPDDSTRGGCSEVNYPEVKVEDPMISLWGEDEPMFERISRGQLTLERASLWEEEGPILERSSLEDPTLEGTRLWEGEDQVLKLPPLMLREMVPIKEDRDVPNTEGKVGTSLEEKQKGQRANAKLKGVQNKHMNGRWRGQINHKGSLIGLGSYDSQREAAVAFDQACLMLRGRDTDTTLNYTLEDYLDDQGNVVEDPSIRELLTRKGFRTHNTVVKATATASTLIYSPLTGDKEVIKKQESTHQGKEAVGTSGTAVKEVKIRRGTRPSTRGKWSSQINHRGTIIGLGTYDTQFEAAIAFDQASLMLRGRSTETLNFSLSDYLDGQGNFVEDLRIRDLLISNGFVRLSCHGADGRRAPASEPLLGLPMATEEGPQKKKQRTGLQDGVGTSKGALPNKEATADTNVKGQTVRGVYLIPGGKWNSRISYKRTRIGLGTFDTQQEAAVAFDKACLYLRGRDTELNFDLSNYLDARGRIVKDPLIRDRIGLHTKDLESLKRVKPCPSSRVAVKRSGPSPAIAQNKKKYKGTYNKTPGRWMSQICYEGKFLRLGTFSSDSDAAVAFDNACLYLRGRDAELNFKLSNYLNAKGEIVLDPSLLKLINSGLERHGLKRPTRHRLKTCPSSKITAKSPGSLPAMNNRKKLKGIYCTASGKWTSQIHHQGKLLYLGLFASEREAAVVYDKACLYLRGRDAELNFKLSDYLNARGEIIEDPSIRLCLATHGIYSLGGARAGQKGVQAPPKGKASSFEAHLAKQSVSKSVKAARGRPSGTAPVTSKRLRPAPVTSPQGKRLGTVPVTSPQGKRLGAAPALFSSSGPQGSSNPEMKSSTEARQNPRHRQKSSGSSLPEALKGSSLKTARTDKRRKVASLSALPGPSHREGSHGEESGPRDVAGPICLSAPSLSLGVLKGVELVTEAHSKAPGVSATGFSDPIRKDHSQELHDAETASRISHEASDSVNRPAAPLSRSLKPIPLDSPALLLLAQIEQLPDDIHSVELSELNIELSGLRHPATMAMAACVACHLGKAALSDWETITLIKTLSHPEEQRNAAAQPHALPLSAQPLPQSDASDLCSLRRLYRLLVLSSVVAEVPPVDLQEVGIGRLTLLSMLATVHFHKELDGAEQLPDVFPEGKSELLDQVSERLFSFKDWLDQEKAVEVAILVLNCIGDAKFQRPDLLALVALAVARLDQRLSRPTEGAEVAVMRIFAAAAGLDAGRVASATPAVPCVSGGLLGRSDLVDGGLAALARSARLVRAFAALAAYKPDSVPRTVHTASILYPKVKDAKLKWGANVTLRAVFIALSLGCTPSQLGTMIETAMLEFSSLITSVPGLVRCPPIALPPSVEDPIVGDMLCSAMAAVRNPSEDALEDGSGASTAGKLERSEAPKHEENLQLEGGYLFQKLSIRKITLELMHTIGVFDMPKVQP